MSFTKFVFATDVHGDMQCPEANAVLFNFIDVYKPKLRVFGGDLWDFRAIRRGASDDEKQESMSADYVAGINWLKRFKPHYFLRGNHDERLWELAAKRKGPCSDYAFSGVVEVTTLTEKMRCKMLPYHHRDGILKIGHMKMLHGFHAGINAARQTALVYGSALFGHVHTIDEHSIPGLERDFISFSMTGRTFAIATSTISVMSNCESSESDSNSVTDVADSRNCFKIFFSFSPVFTAHL